MKMFRKISLIRIAASLSMLVVALSVAYYLVIFLPQKEKTRQEQINRELEFKQAEQEQNQKELELNQAEQEAANSKELQVYKDCDTEAGKNAKKLLKSKIEIAQEAGTYIPPTWKEASEKGLFLKDDYNSYYDSCLRRHGIKY